VHHLALGRQLAVGIRRLGGRAILAAQLADNVIVTLDIEWQLNPLALVRLQVVFVERLDLGLAAF
jgi:hypothetical protein